MHTSTVITRNAPVVPKTDTEIAIAVNSVLKNDTYLGRHRILARVEDGIVCLQGTVSSDLQRKSAVNLIWDLPGVEGIRNYICVCPGVDVA